MVLLLLLLLPSLSSTNRSCLSLSIFISYVFSPCSHLVLPSSPFASCLPLRFSLGSTFLLFIFFHSLFDVNYWSEQKGGDWTHNRRPGLLDWMRLSLTWFWLVPTWRAFTRWFKRKGNTNTCNSSSGWYILGEKKQLLRYCHPWAFTTTSQWLHYTVQRLV